MKLGLEIKERHCLETEENRTSDLAGSLERISSMISWGKAGMVINDDDDDDSSKLFSRFAFPISLARRA